MGFRLVAAVLVAAVLTLTVSAAPGFLPPRISTSPANDAAKDKPRATRTLLGPQAEKFVRELAASNETFRKAQERSEARLEAKGWKRSGITFVQFGAKPKNSTPAPRRGFMASLRDRLVTPLGAAQDAESEEGFIVSTGWDDGNDFNMEANLYVELYDGYNSYASIDLQMVIPEDGSIWYRQWAGGEFGDRDHGPREANFESLAPTGPALRKAKFQTACTCVMFRRGGSAGCILDNALMSSWDICLTAVELCFRRSWPAAWACINTWGARACGMAFGVGMIRAVSQWFRDCRAQGYF
jgi:hypothetical protein